MEANNGRYECVVIAWEALRRVGFYTYAPGVVGLDNRAEAGEFVLRANTELLVGNFDFDIEAGQICFRVSVDMADLTPSTAFLRTLAYTSLLTMDRHAVALWSVMMGGSTALDALGLIGQNRS